MEEIFKSNVFKYMSTKKLFVTIMAGGLGKRMQSDLPKVLLKVRGESMIVRLIKQVIKLNPSKILIIVGKYKSIIRKEIGSNIIDNRIIYINQPIPLGTGDAIKCTLSQFDTNDIVDNIILNGDMPLLKGETINKIYLDFLRTSSKFLITSVNLENPTGNGRIIMNSDRCFREIVEEKDCNSDQKLITLVNAGIYCCKSDVLLDFIPKINNKNAQSEYYLTDLVKIYSDAGNKIDLFFLPRESEMEIYNVNTKDQLHIAESYC